MMETNAAGMSWEIQSKKYLHLEHLMVVSCSLRKLLKAFEANNLQ
jgi:hypothetical protein